MFNVTTRSGTVLETFEKRENAEAFKDKLQGEDLYRFTSLFVEDTNEFWSLTKVRLNRGGYTDKGRYFGTGQPLFCLSNPHNGASYFFRAENREEILGWVSKAFPSARVKGYKAMVKRIAREVHAKGLEALAEAKAYQDSAKTYPFKIVGRFQGGKLEEIDSFKTFEAANTMLAKYRKDFGDSWTLAIPG